MLLDALQIYRETYRPSARHPEPRALVAVNVVCADSDDEAGFHFTSLQQRFLGMRRGIRGPLPLPVASMEGLWTPAEREQVMRMLWASAVGSPDTVARQLNRLLELTRADELIVAGATHDPAVRLRSLSLLAGVRARLDAGAGALA
jgi:alkanesulfonate monooxygenase SsuD/methylene tetrahydromethanopterin reductase-like flavin-dependent oxidoreductase (luciferase family)